MHNLPIPHTFVTFSPVLKNLFYKLREALTPIEDQWTWTTNDGVVFEEVEVKAIESNKVTFGHKFGKVCLPIAVFAEDVQMKLNDGYEWARYSQSRATKTEMVSQPALFSSAAAAC